MTVSRQSGISQLEKQSPHLSVADIVIYLLSVLAGLLSTNIDDVVELGLLHVGLEDVNNGALHLEEAAESNIVCSPASEYSMYHCQWKSCQYTGLAPHELNKLNGFVRIPYKF